MSHGPYDPEPTWPVYAPAPSPVHPIPYAPVHPIPYAPPTHPQAVTALVLGLLSLVVCPVLGVAAVVVGLTVQRGCDLAPGRWGGRGCGTAGFVLGLVALSVSACWVLVALTSLAARG